MCDDGDRILVQQRRSLAVHPNTQAPLTVWSERRVGPSRDRSLLYLIRRDVNGIAGWDGLGGRRSFLTPAMIWIICGGHLRRRKPGAAGGRRRAQAGECGCWARAACAMRVLRTAAAFSRVLVPFPRAGKAGSSKDEPTQWRPPVVAPRWLQRGAANARQARQRPASNLRNVRTHVCRPTRTLALARGGGAAPNVRRAAGGGPLFGGAAARSDDSENTCFP